MRRHLAATATARMGNTAIPSTIQILTAALAAVVLATGFATPAPAQTPGERCGSGLMTSGEAGTGTLLLKTATPGCFFPAPRVAADIAVDVSGPIARTRVTQRFENPAAGWVEGVYVFPLPETAAVDTLKMQVGDRFIEGEIRERQEAKRIYEAAKTEGKTASLVEQERPNVFTNSLANIGPHETIVVQIEYQESLRFESGHYHLRVPLVVAPRYSPKPRANVIAVSETDTLVRIADPVPDRDRLETPVLRPEWGKVNPVRLSVHIEAGFPLGSVESTSHPLTVTRASGSAASVVLDQGDVPADRDFDLSFAPAEGAAPAISLLKETVQGSDYLLALVVPPANLDAAPSKPREVVFVLDNSGSMGGESIRQAKASLLLALSRLTPADKFNVIRFDDTLTVLFQEPVDATPGNIAFARNYVSGLDANGGTEMLPALLAALRDASPEDVSRLRQVIFLTDGAVGNEAELFKAIGEKLGRSRLFTVGIGSALNSYFMSGAARAGRGTFTYIGDTAEVAPRMAELFAKLERPVMTELSVRWPASLGGEAWPNPLPDLYQGEPVIVAVRGENAQGSVVIAGNLGGTSWQQTIDLAGAESAHGIEKLWARFKIAALDESRVRGADPTEIDNSVLAVALSHHLASRLTSLVAVDVTPRRPESADLTTAHVPVNLPSGWDFDKVFGETVVPRERDAQTEAPAAVLASLKVNDAAPAATAPGDAGLHLPQGGTDAELMLILGALSLLAGLLLIRARGAA
jgi:Ca-activated chloride channel homolog